MSKWNVDLVKTIRKSCTLGGIEADSEEAATQLAIDMSLSQEWHLVDEVVDRKAISSADTEEAAPAAAEAEAAEEAAPPEAIASAEAAPSTEEVVANP